MPVVARRPADHIVSPRGYVPRHKGKKKDSDIIYQPVRKIL